MSPRAAWQLEALGFERVYDFAGGKVEWILSGLPLEGRGPHFPLAGEAVRLDLTVCKRGERAGDIADRMEGEDRDFCVVVNDEGILLGRLWPKSVRENPDKSVEQVMEPGPTTVRATESAGALLERMERRKVPAVLVATAKGQLLGLAHVEDLRELVAGKESLSRFDRRYRHERRNLRGR